MEKQKYKEFIVCVSSTSISITRDGRTTIGPNELGKVTINTDKQEVKVG